MKRIHLQPILSGAGRYLLALLFVAAAAGIACLTNPRVGESTASLFCAAVVLSSWTGGLGPGLVATALATLLAGDFYRLNPMRAHSFGWDDSLQGGVFLIVTALISSLTSLRRRAENALQKSFEELETRIARRTSELSQFNALLRESEERFRLMVEGVTDYAMVMLDSKGTVIGWNPGARRIFGYSDHKAIGLGTSIFYAPEEATRGKPAAELLDAAQSGRREDEGWRIRQDGTRFWANVITTALRDETQNLRGFAQITRDVSELRSLEKELLEISEREQMRIGHDLHDGVGQELTGIALLTQNLRQRLAAQNVPEEAQAARIASLVNRSIEQVRKLARGFSPMELGPRGLETSLRDLAAKVQSSMHRKCAFTCRGSIGIADEAAALHLFRIAQEAVNNSVRHSQARQIRIELDTIDGATTLAVHDDGIGMPESKRRGKGIGISVMQYRARMIGGSLEIGSSPGGTSITCTCPNPQAHESPASRRQEAATILSRGAVARLIGR